MFSGSPAFTACLALCSRWAAGPKRYLKKSMMVRLLRHWRKARIVAHQDARMGFLAISAPAFGAGHIASAYCRAAT